MLQRKLLHKIHTYPTWYLHYTLLGVTTTLYWNVWYSNIEMNSRRDKAAIHFSVDRPAPWWQQWQLENFLQFTHQSYCQSWSRVLSFVRFWVPMIDQVTKCVLDRSQFCYQSWYCWLLQSGQDVQVMGSFDGWTRGEQLSPESTGTFTKFAATIKLRPGR